MQDPIDLKQLLQMYRNGKMIPEHYGDYWSEDDRQRLKSMFEEGEGISEIALRLERSESSVFQQLVSMDMFADSKISRTRKRSPSGCKCEICSIQDCDRPDYCPKSGMGE